MGSRHGKDDRLYAKFDIHMDEHPKIMLLSDAAFRALYEATFYCRRQLTDGFIAERVARKKWGDEVIIELTTNSVERPSWRIGTKDGHEGFWIHDFEEHQTTNADIAAKRAAGRKGGEAKARNAAARAASASTGVAPASTRLAPASPKQDTESPDRTEDHGGEDAVLPLADLAEGLAAASTTLAKTETETETKTPLSTRGGAGETPPTERVNVRTKTAKEFPEQFWITAGMKAWAAENVPQVQVADETKRFADHYRAEGGAKGRKKDWEATWRNWMRSEFTVGSPAYQAKLGHKVQAYRHEPPSTRRQRIKPGENPYAD